MRRAARPLFLALLFVLGAHVAHACSCADRKSPLKELGRARAVFVGEVIEVSVSKETPKDDPEFAFAVKFRVETFWKGIKSSEIVVSSSQGIVPCGGKFRVGEKWLVYAYGKYLQADICTRTALLTNAKEDLKALGQGKLPKGSAEFRLAPVPNSQQSVALNEKHLVLRQSEVEG